MLKYMLDKILYYSLYLPFFKKKHTYNTFKELLLDILTDILAIFLFVVFIKPARFVYREWKKHKERKEEEKRKEEMFRNSIKIEND